MQCKGAFIFIKDKMVLVEARQLFII